MPQESIGQRARDLQRLLGHSGARAASPAPSLRGQPFTLASLDEWTAAWAESEVAVLTTAVEVFRSWTQMWMLRELHITGGMAIGAPGCVQGPPSLVAATIMGSSLMPKRAEARQFCEKAAVVIDRWFGRVREALSVPTLPWYPSFVMHPGPVAPMTPCAPGRMSDLTQLAGGVMIDAVLADELYREATTPGWAKHFGDNQGDLGRIVCNRIAKDLVAYVHQVFQLAMVQGVMGQGTVLGYAPPAVVAGPVVGRTIPSVGFLRGVESVPSPLLLRS